MIGDRSLIESSDDVLQADIKNHKKRVISLFDLVLVEKEARPMLSKHERHTKMMDKIKYFINSLTVYISLCIIITKPSYYPYFSAFTLSAQIIHRYFEFSAHRWQLYLIDFCYLTNFLTILYIFFPTNYTLYIVAFGFSTGPILLTCVVYNLSLSFHSTIKFTSYWTHFSPGLSMLIVRWFDSSNFFFGEEFFSKKVFGFEFYYEYILMH